MDSGFAPEVNSRRSEQITVYDSFVEVSIKAFIVFAYPNVLRITIVSSLAPVPFLFPSLRCRSVRKDGWSD